MIRLFIENFNMVIKPQGAIKGEEFFLLIERILGHQEGLCSMELFRYGRNKIV
jgi:hypothetical protein